MKWSPFQDDVSYVGSDLQYPTLHTRALVQRVSSTDVWDHRRFYFFCLRFGPWGISLIPVGAHIPVGNARALIPHML
jgi:hypothetical protein